MGGLPLEESPLLSFLLVGKNLRNMGKYKKKIKLPEENLVMQTISQNFEFNLRNPFISSLPQLLHFGDFSFQIADCHCQI